MIRETTTKEKMELLHRDIDVIRGKLKKYSRWERVPMMFMSCQEIREFEAIGKEYSILILNLLEDEVCLDKRYLKGDWQVYETLEDLVCRGLRADV